MLESTKNDSQGQAERAERRPHVNMLVLLPLLSLLICSCFTRKADRERDDQSRIWSDNCSGYTFNYTDKFNNEDDCRNDSVTIYGKVRYCSMHKKLPGSTICFLEGDSLKFSTRADKRGYYEIKIKRGVYSIIAEGSRGSLLIPRVLLGQMGCSMNIDMKLLRHYVFIHSMQLTRKDIRQIKKNRKRSKH
ncbi:hypothetical protein BDE36_2195 [Arcticibacter tournemirensis]|nr:hypothetical protein BDE36_2195 [Arcticibacter tournemirensis]